MHVHRARPQPPADSRAWRGKSPKHGALYQVHCPDSPHVGAVFIPTGAGPAAPTIDPEFARHAVGSMRLDGPTVGSPRAAGRYVVGMSMWMWVTPSATTFGPAIASATAGGVTVTANAKVPSIRWDNGAAR
ncbi:hypothetical protein ACGFMM_24975 [Streptomyces sp. NPDC048604]|uniref:hypothetical protein n=1 Tax=Streptomyces sp. NPDC048604 TaxID=3365578 RepID=UPI00372089AB